MFARSLAQVSRVLGKNSNLNPVVVSARYLNLQEFQSKQLLGDAGVNVQRFVVVDNAKDCQGKMNTFHANEYVIKAQVLAGGRGKGTFDNGFKGGVRLSREKKEVCDFVGNMVGHKLMTHQTGEDGVMVNRVMIAESLDIHRETYLAILMDREFSGPVIVASPDGGVEIEEVAASHPERIFKMPVDIKEGLTKEKAMELAKDLDFKGPLQESAAAQIQKLYELFLKVDAVQIEINPFSETTPVGKENEPRQVYCIDAKLNFDDFAGFRQKDIFAMDDHAEQDPSEHQAELANLSYIRMDGNIACLVNGAGLAMATMDIIKLYGGEPANFLDVGGNVKEDQVLEAFRIIVSDPRVKAILVNIFGGIVNCATIANGLTSAFQKMELKVPLVVRLEGTNVDEARKILEGSKLPIITAGDLDDAAKKSVGCLPK